jgi:nucleoid-associated protein YgaU
MPHARYRARHRQAKTARRLAAVGALGLGTAAVSAIIAPAVADAATSGQWNAVAHCESGGNWSDDTGNGYYGGLQFSASTWDAYGGGAYAARASDASASEQMSVANRVLAAQGWDAWPVCSRVAGVTGVPTATGVDTHPSSAPTSTDLRKASAPTFVPAVKGAHYVVKPHDTLYGIAEQHHVKGGWTTIYTINKSVIGSNPSLILPGMKVKL